MSVTPEPPLEYVGFGPRFVATLVDTLWVTPVVAVLGLLYQRSDDSALLDQLLRDPEHVSTRALAAAGSSAWSDSLIQCLLAALLVLLWWFARNATPGKLLVHAKIVDARTGAPPSKRQLLVRYLGYYLSMLPFGLGFLWIAIDPRKQGWHDKLAGTVVVRPATSNAARFPGRSA